MPKSKWGENPRATEARERNETKKLVERTRKEKAVEEAKWVESDSKILKKFERKAEEERKHEEQLARKRENARLAEEEMNQLSGKSSGKEQAKKVTQFEILQEKERLAQLSKQSVSSQKRPPASTSSRPLKVESTEASAAANASSDSSSAVIESAPKASDLSAVTLPSETSETASAAAVSSSGIELASSSALSTAGSEHTEDPNLTSAASSSQLLPRNVSVPARALEQNLNRERGLGGTGEAGVLDAHSVDEALAALSVAQRGSAAALADAARDRRTVHKRARVAFRQFEEENLNRLRAENPSLKLSQVKQLLRDEWESAPENPINQLEVTARSLARYTAGDDDGSSDES